MACTRCRGVGTKNALAAAFLAAHGDVRIAARLRLLCRFRLAYLVGWMIIVGCLVLEHWIARRRSLKLDQRPRSSGLMPS